MQISDALKAIVGDDIDTVISFQEGDNEGGIFRADMGFYKFVVVGFAENPSFTIVDEDFETIEEAIFRFHGFLQNEYDGVVSFEKFE